MSVRVRRPARPRSRKGSSGNPRGRPKATPPAADRSAFDIILNRRLTVSQSGKEREMTVEEALQHRTYQDALAGNCTARREVLKMIAEREQWRAERAPRPKPKPIEEKIEDDPRNADEAMLLLGLAIPDPQWEGMDNGGDERLQLARWAVQAALGRRGHAPLSEREMEEIERCTAKDAPDPQQAAEP